MLTQEQKNTRDKIVSELEQKIADKEAIKTNTISIHVQNLAKIQEEIDQLTLQRDGLMTFDNEEILQTKVNELQAIIDAKP